MRARGVQIASGPGWVEIILGIVLSLLLGLAVGVLALVLRPVISVREMPKEADRVPGAVYYLEGSRDPSRASQADLKRRSLVAGQSVAVVEDELNALLAADPSAKLDPAAAAQQMVAPGAPSIRIREGVVQVTVPVTINVLGLSQKVPARARGGFVREDNLWVFRPDDLMLGSCPVASLPYVGGVIRAAVLRSIPRPEDLAAVWPKLAEVSVEGDVLNLRLP